MVKKNPVHTRLDSRFSFQYLLPNSPLKTSPTIIQLVLHPSPTIPTIHSIELFVATTPALFSSLPLSLTLSLTFPTIIPFVAPSHYGSIKNLY